MQDRGWGCGMSNKVLFRDIVPYDRPSAWSALAGPASGVIDLPISVFWGPDRSFDLSDPDEVRFAYQQLVREGTSEVQSGLLNPTLLRREWARLVLPDRCRAAWEAAFPELVA